ncbi:MAG: DMT family transporter [Solirubrobacteraceae bacterium]
MTARQVGLLGALAALWGASYLLIKYALKDFSPSALVCLRTALGAAVLYGVIRLTAPEARAALGEVRRRPGTALLFSTLAIAAPFLLIAVGERRVPSGLTAVLIASAPLFVAVFAPFLDPSEAVARRQGLGLLLGLGGVALLVGVETIATLAEFLSALGIVAAAACYTLSTFMVRRAYRDLPSLATSFVSVCGGALLTLVPAALTAPRHWPQARSVAALAILGVAGTALAFVIFYRLIAEVGAGRASLVSYLIPPISLAYGASALGEPITPAAVGGLVAILAGVGLASRGPAPAPEGAEAIPAEEPARR